MSTFGNLPTAYLPPRQRPERHVATYPHRDPDESIDFSALRRRLDEGKGKYPDGPPCTYPSLLLLDNSGGTTPRTNGRGNDRH